MIPITQTVIGPTGNCFSACLASLLEIDIRNVPNFAEDPYERYESRAKRIREFLAPFGLSAMAYDGKFTPPNGYYIMTGISPRGRLHAVVGLGHEIAFDPHPTRAGLSAVTGFVVLVPAVGA